MLILQFSSVAQSCLTLCYPMNRSIPGLPVHHQLYPNPSPLSQSCHPTISSSVIPFSSCPQSFPASGSFPMSQLFSSGGQSIGVSASTSVLPKNTQELILRHLLFSGLRYLSSRHSHWKLLIYLEIICKPNPIVKFPGNFQKSTKWSFRIHTTAMFQKWGVLKPQHKNSIWRLVVN